MKIVINSGHGAFGISNEALIRLIERGASIVLEHPYSPPLDPVPLRDGFIGDKDYPGMVDKDSVSYCLAGGDDVRGNPDLVAVVEELGKDAGDDLSTLVVIDIPEDVCGWYIIDWAGFEEVHEEHRWWGGEK